MKLENIADVTRYLNLNQVVAIRVKGQDDLVPATLWAAITKAQNGEIDRITLLTEMQEPKVHVANLDCGWTTDVPFTLEEAGPMALHLAKTIATIINDK